MAHSCRWRFPARPGGSSNSATGRRAGRIRVTASLRSVSRAHPNAAALGPGFDAALQVSSVIGSNLQKFRDVLGESSDSSSGEVSTGTGTGNRSGASRPDAWTGTVRWTRSCRAWCTWRGEVGMMSSQILPVPYVEDLILSPSAKCGCGQTCHFQDAW